MFKQNDPKVAIDTNLDQQVPTVVVSSMSPDSFAKKNTGKTNFHESSDNLPVSFVRHIVNFFFDFLETIVVALSIFVVVYLFIAQPHEVKGSSMEPSFHNNEYIFTDKISYRFREPQRGDVVIFKAPTNPDVDYIKRIIGLSGERVKIEKGQVYINDKKLDEVYLRDLTVLFPGSQMQEGINITVSEGEYFVMGDNRPHSSDSREFGPIPQKLIIGRAILRYWPPPQVGIIKGINYQMGITSDKSS